MTVFKTILKILNRLKGMLILYTIVLLLITVLNQTNKDNVTNFEETKPSILVINKDKENTISEGLEKYIKSHFMCSCLLHSNRTWLDDKRHHYS